MSRVIKFRAWDIKRNKYIDNPQAEVGTTWEWNEDSGYEEEVYESEVYINWIFTEEAQASQGYILEQFTGLHDKNGKEVYEGDLLTLTNCDDETHKFVCEWGIIRRTMDSGAIVDIPSFTFKRLMDGFCSYPIVNNYLMKHDLEILEVIGNIHEQESK